MKTLRLFTIALLAVLVMSTWAPFPAYAQPSGAANSVTLNVDLATTVKLAKLTANNHTGGNLYISLVGAQSYRFVASKQGKTVFKDIKPGKYTVTLTTSACQGKLTFKRNFKANGNVGLPNVFCRKK